MVGRNVVGGSLVVGLRVGVGVPQRYPDSDRNRVRRYPDSDRNRGKIATYTSTPEVNDMSESEQQVDGSGKRQKRGPFLSVNSSTSVSEDNDVELLADNDNDYYLKQQRRQECRLTNQER